MIGELSDFLDYARNSLTNSNDPLPCEPEDCAAVMGYLYALVPSYQLDRQQEMQDGETRRADRRAAALNGFRRVRGATTDGTNGTNGSSSRLRLLPAPGKLPARQAPEDDDEAPEVA